MIRILGSIIPLILALLAVVAVIYLSYIFSKYMAIGGSRMSGAKYMRIVDRMMLGQDKMIAIVQIGTSYYLAGVTSQNVQILKELEGEELIEMEPTAQMASFQSMDSFKGLLDKHVSKKG